MTDLHGGERTRRNSYIFWGVAFVLWLFCELTGLFRRRSAALREVFPQFTLSETVWAVIRAVPWKPLRNVVRAGIWAFCLSLGCHLALGTPLFPGLGH